MSDSSSSSSPTNRLSTNEKAKRSPIPSRLSPVRMQSVKVSGPDSSLASPTSPTTMFDMLQAETSQPVSSVEIMSPFKPHSRTNSHSKTPSAASSYTQEQSVDESSAVPTFSRHVKKPSDSSTLRELLATVSEKETEQLMKISQSPMDIQNIPARLSEVFHNKDGIETDKIASTRTEALAKQVKEQFEQKYGTIYGIVGKDSKYNPLVAIRKRQTDERKNKLSRRKKSEDSPWEVQPQEIQQMAQISTQESPSPASKTGKKSWKSIFKNKSKSQNATPDSSAAQSPISLKPQITQPSSQSDDSQNARRELASPRTSAHSDNTSSIHSKRSSKNLSSTQLSPNIIVSDDASESPEYPQPPYTAASSKVSPASLPESTSQPKTASKHRRGSSFMGTAAPAWFPGRKEESAPATTQLSPTNEGTETEEEEKKLERARNMEKIKQKLKSLRKSPSVDGLESVEKAEGNLEVPGALKVAKRTSRGLTFNDGSDKAKKILVGKISNGSMKSSEGENFKLYRYKKNLELFEKRIRKKKSLMDLDQLDMQDDIEDQKPFFLNPSKYSRMLLRIRRNRSVIYSGAEQLCQNKTEMIITYIDDTDAHSKQQFTLHNQLLGQSMSVKAQKEHLIQEISKLNQKLGYILKNDVIQAETVQEEISSGIAVSMRKLEKASQILNNELIPRLNDYKNTYGELMKDKKTTNNLSEWGYSILAIILNNAAWVFWLYSVTQRWFRRVFYVEPVPTAQSNRRVSDSGLEKTEDSSMSFPTMRARRGSVFSRTGTSPTKDEEKRRRWLKTSVERRKTVEDIVE